MSPDEPMDESPEGLAARHAHDIAYAKLGVAEDLSWPLAIGLGSCGACYFHHWLPLVVLAPICYWLATRPYRKGLHAADQGLRSHAPRGAGLLVVLVLAAGAGDAEARSRTVLRDFQRAHPCPSTNASRGACPGFEIDHIQPLCAGGPDAVDNLQWLSHADHRMKTKRDVAACRRWVYRP